MIGISINKCNAYIYLEVPNMTLYYCMSKDTMTRAIYQLVHMNERWVIFEVFENENKMIDIEAIGEFETEEKAIDFLITHYKTVYSMNGGE